MKRRIEVGGRQGRDDPRSYVVSEKVMRRLWWAMIALWIAVGARALLS